MKIIILTLIIFLANFINPTYVSADACSPWVCAGSNGYLRVLDCKYMGTGSSGYCSNWQNKHDTFNCDAATCTGWAPGVEYCVSTPITTVGTCTCSAPGSCAAGSVAGSSCGTTAYPGTCQDCTPAPGCGEPQGGTRGCCVPGSSGSPTPTPLPTPTPSTTPLSCNSLCTKNSQCSSVNPLWTCYNTGTDKRCRVALNPTSISCVPCYPSCGGTLCGSTSEVPNQVTNVKVNGIISGNINLTSSSNLNITWSDPGVSDPNSTINYYIIKIWDKIQGTTPPGTCNATTNCVSYQTASKIESYTAAASTTHDNDIYISVRAVNNTCVPVGRGAWSTNSSYNLVARVGGNFYNDQSASPDAFNNCNSSSTSPVNLSTQTGTTVTTSIGGNSGAIGTSYLINNVPYAPTSAWNDYGFNVSLAINNSNPANAIICTCPIDLLDPFLCKHTNTASPALNENIYLSSINLSNESWWQASGGNVYGANSLISLIPDTCDLDSSCNAFIVTQNADADVKSAGIPLTGAATMNSNGYFSERGALEPKAIDTDHNNLIKEDYAYFSRGVDLSTATTITGTITALPTGATPDADQTEIYYSNGNLTIDISSTKNVASGKKIVIFVNGNLTFSSDPNLNLITVAQGGFIGFIASGNITFDANIGNTTATDSDPNIAGVFVADGLIKVNGYSDAPLNDDTLKDNKFVGEGTFVGWSGFTLTRNYENTTNLLQKELNNTNPIEVFVFRPDFNKNIPDMMMRPSLIWQEVN